METASIPLAHRATSSPTRSFLARAASLVYGAGIYAGFLATFLYAIAFVSGVLVPTDVNGGRPATLTEALLVNGGILALFALQHTIMARRSFKARWTEIVPVHLERSTFVLVTCLILGTLFWQWRALPGVVWHVEGAAAVALWTLSGLGWATVLVATFLIDHFELFGLRQTVLYALGRDHTQPRFVERSLYKLVRHPLMLGFLVAFWATPHMTTGHLVFAITTTAYILVAIQIEERDLVGLHGDQYREYRKQVGMIIPWPKRAAPPSPDA